MSLIAHFFPMRCFLPNSAQTDGPCANEAGQAGNRASSSWMQDICSHAMFLCNDCIYSRIRFKNAPGGPSVPGPSVILTAWVEAMGQENSTISGAQSCCSWRFLPLNSLVKEPRIEPRSWYDTIRTLLSSLNMSQDTAEQGDMSSMKEGSRQQVNRYFHRGQQIAQLYLAQVISQRGEERNTELSLTRHAVPLK